MPSNLPPGVEPHMIPGNTPEELVEEEWWTKFEDKAGGLNHAIPSEVWDKEWFVEAVNLAKEMGYEQGFNEGEVNERYKSDESSD